MNNIITIGMNFGLNTFDIETIKKIEKDIDEALLKNGFNRTESFKDGNVTEIIYKQIG